MSGYNCGAEASSSVPCHTQLKYSREVWGGKRLLADTILDISLFQKVQGNDNTVDLRERLVQLSLLYRRRKLDLLI